MTASSCPDCGTGLDGDYRFCPRCGHDFYEEAARPTPEPPWVTARHKKEPKAAMSTAEAFFGCIGAVAAGIIGFLLGLALAGFPGALVGALLGLLVSAVFIGLLVVIRQAVR